MCHCPRCKQGGRVSCHIKSSCGVQVASKPHHLHQTLVYGVIIKIPTSKVEKVASKVERGCISSLHGVQAKPSAMSSIKWLSKVWVHCTKYGLFSHMCAIMTISVKCKPICPSSKVQKMCEPVFEYVKPSNDLMLCITHAISCK
jgi:hypothetical protein